MKEKHEFLIMMVSTIISVIILYYLIIIGQQISFKNDMWLLNYALFTMFIFCIPNIIGILIIINSKEEKTSHSS